MAGEADERQTEAPEAGAVPEDRIEGKIDRDLRDSFPASDPPGWVLGVRRTPTVEEGADAGGPPAAATDDAGGE
ncbi:MAG TPA: hypothetical protein VJ866_09515 [Pyrinomonadaceae bacterium]|nr:hypothetical protein [Pyrinomonadaceae bacterium]